MCNIYSVTGLFCIFLVHIVSCQRCPYGWMDRPRGDSCYLIATSNMKYTWTEGRARCQQLQASFFKLNNVQERDWLMRTLRNVTSVYPDAVDWWSGAYNKGDGSGWLWSVDDTKADASLIYWASGAAPADSSNKHCANIYGQGFNSSGCNNWKRIICERPKSLPLLCKSDGGWQYSNGSCYKYLGSKRTWDDASAYCHKYNSHLSYVTGEDSQRFLWDMARDNKNKVWIGLKSAQTRSTVSWNWDSGPALGTGPTYWAQNNPGKLDQKDLNSSCVELGQGIRRKQSWLVAPCSELNAFSCQKPQGVCPDGWLQHQDNCLSFNPMFSLPWDQASSYCISQGAKLLKIITPAEQTFVNLYLKEQTLAGIKSLWIGITDDNQDSGPFQWSDGKPLGDYKNWAPMNPNNTGGNRDCGYIDTTDSTGRWQTSSDCTELKSFVCVIPVNTPVVQVTTPAPHYLCDAGWVVHGTNCYKFQDTDLSWILARDTCQALTADLATITDAGTQEFLNKHIQGADYWVGLQDRGKEGTFVWLDSNAQLSYTHWNKNEPNNQGNENCVAILGKWGADQNGKWNDYSCSRTFNFICQKGATNVVTPPVIQPPTRPSVISKKCGAFWEESPGSDNCYQFNEDMLSWMDAKDMCARRGGNLASINTVTEQFYIAGRIRGLNIVAMWTGANDRNSEGGWMWDDGSPFAYMNWVPGEPNDYGNGEDCGIIVVNSAKWNDFSCTRRNGYICKKLGNIRVTTPQPSTSPATVPAGKFYGCPPGWRPYQNSCYLVVKTQVTWPAARTACRKAGGDLASIGSKAENQFINSQIQREKCINNHPNDTECERWAEDRECQKNPIWMAANCRDACALCEFVCADRHTLNECAFWADKGECKKNPDWMHVHCALSCGRCDSGSNDGVWTGLNDLKTTDSFVWADGAPNKYTNWARNEPNNYQGHQEDCVVLYTNGGEWNDDVCDTNHGYVCKTSKQILATTQQSPFSVGCMKGSLGYQHYCYQFNNLPLNWQSAENGCKQRGGHLATVNNYVVQSFLASELTNKDDVYWIGLSDTASPGTYKWATGDKLLFTPWDKSHTGNERSTCVAMRTSQPTGLWKNYQCNVIKPYICQLPRAGFTAAPTTQPTTTSVPLPCASGWSGYGAFCYKAFRMGNAQRKTWSEAVVYCQGFGGDLMSIHSKDQENFIETTLLRYYYNANFWVGLSDRTKEGSYVWSDGSPTDYTNWYYTEPNNSGGDEDCVEFNQASRQWNDNSCFQAKDFICQIPRGVTVPTTTIRTTTPIVSCAGVEKGWSFYNGSCYFVSPSYGINAKKTWYEAMRYCMGEGGDLASIHNINENNFITTLVTKRTQGIYWIGLNQLGRDDYVWSDGSSSDFLKWKPGEPNDAFGGQLCVNLYGGSLAGPGLWNDDNCMDINNYICKRSNGSFSTVTPAPTSPLTGGCPPGYTPFDNKCFAIGGLNPISRMNWTDARDQCRKQGKQYDIASINSYADQAFLVIFMKQKGVTSSLWIGLNDRNKNGHYEWQDNTELTYTNWNKGEPSDHFSYMTYNRQDCISMKSGTGDAVGRWNDDKCSDKKGYICQTLKSNAFATPAPTTSSCKPNYQAFGTSCYRTVTSPTTWQGAQTACKADGGNLVSITDVYEQSFIDTIAHLNNIMNSFWIGLSDKKTSGIYGWYDGWPVYFTKWGKGEPTRNTGEGCVAQQGQYWNDTLCVQNLPFICEISSTTPPPTTPSPPGFCPDKRWIEHGEFCYLSYPTERKSWPEANFVCKQQGMQLVSVHTKAELDFLKVLLDEQTTTPRYTYYFSKPNVWLGLTKTKSGGFGWSDGSPANFFNWNKGEPSDVNGTHHENCVEYYRANYVWNDVDCFINKAFICKAKKTLPSTIPTTTTTTTTTTTPTPTRRPNPTRRPVTFPTPNPTNGPTFRPNYTPRTRPFVVHSLPPFVPGPLHQNPTTSNSLSGGQIAGILIGIIAFIIIVVVVVIVIRRRQPPPPQSPSGGFDNAMYSKDAENVSVANGTNNVYHSEVPDTDA